MSGETRISFILLSLLLISSAIATTNEQVNPEDKGSDSDDSSSGDYEDPPELERIDFENFGLSHKFSNKLNDIFTRSYFLHGFVASLLVIIVSELGDKTFFIAAIMAMKHPRLTILSGALSALAVMTVLAALLGHILSVIPRYITFYASSVLLVIFGVRMLFEAHGMHPGEAAEEMEEVQAELKKDEEAHQYDNMEAGGFTTVKGWEGMGRALFGAVFIQAFTLTFLAEWGDRSQLATIILAARESVVAVIIGGIIGHFLCTSLAVMGGQLIAKRISIKAVTYVGAIVFLAFGLSAFYFGP